MDRAGKIATKSWMKLSPARRRQAIVISLHHKIIDQLLEVLVVQVVDYMLLNVSISRVVLCLYDFLNLLLALNVLQGHRHHHSLGLTFLAELLKAIITLRQNFVCDFVTGRLIQCTGLCNEGEEKDRVDTEHFYTPPSKSGASVQLL